jgi:hypothetical protein
LSDLIADRNGFEKAESVHCQSGLFSLKVSSHTLEMHSVRTYLVYSGLSCGQRESRSFHSRREAIVCFQSM